MEPNSLPVVTPSRLEARETSCGTCASRSRDSRPEQLPWHDSLAASSISTWSTFPEEPGPREIILPHNPLITREMEIQVGDILIGRPLGMSCGCPITHCGVTMEVDRHPASSCGA